MDRARTSVDSGDLPKIHLARPRNVYVALQPILKARAGRFLTAEDFLPLRNEVIEVLPKAVKTPTVVGLLTTILMAPRTKKEMDFYALRIAGNVDALVRGDAINMKPGVAPDSWNVGMVIEIENIVTRKAGWRKKVWLKILAGPWAGDEVAMINSSRGLWVLGAQNGFSRFKDHLKMWHVDELVGFLFTVYVKNPDNPRWGPMVPDWGTTSSQFAHNRVLARERRKGVCPHGIVPMDCEGCARGTDTCKFGVRQFTWIQKKCEKCGEVGWHNPRDAEVCCKCNNGRLHALHKEYHGTE